MTITEQFETYRTEVMPAKADRVQVVECKRAFFAGAQAYRAARSGFESLSDAMELFDELEGFCADVLAGRE